MFSSYSSETITVTTTGPASRKSGPAEQKPAPRKPVKISFDGQKPAAEPAVPETVEDAVETSAPVSEPAAEAPSEPVAAPEPAVSSGPTKAEVALANEVKRINAEYANYRARVQRADAAASGLAVKDTLEKLLPVLDDISAARKYGDLEEGPFASISNKLSTVLSDLGLEVLGEIGEEFNPEIHEALIRQPNEEIPEDHVAMILREGYRIGDRLIRAAQVVVSAG